MGKIQHTAEYFRVFFYNRVRLQTTATVQTCASRTATTKETTDESQYLLLCKYPSRKKPTPLTNNFSFGSPSPDYTDRSQRRSAILIKEKRTVWLLERFKRSQTACNDMVKSSVEMGIRQVVYVSLENPHTCVPTTLFGRTSPPHTPRTKNVSVCRHRTPVVEQNFT